MNKALRTIRTMLVCLLAVALTGFAAFAEEASAPVAAVSGLLLVGDLPKDAEVVEDTGDAEGNYREALLTGDGAIWILTARQAVGGDYPMEMAAADLIQKYFELEAAPELAVVEANPVAAYPTERVRFETGENEDSSVHDVVLIRTDAYFFIFEARTSVDIYEGYTDGYEAGDAASLIDGWVESLDLFDAGDAASGA